MNNTLIIENLGVNFDSTNPQDYIEVLDKIALSAPECVKNMGAYSDITHIELSSEWKSEVCDEYVSTDVQVKEVSGAVKKENDATELQYLSFDQLLANAKPFTAASVIQKGVWTVNIEEVSDTVLGGTIQYHECDPQEKCGECHGRGYCVTCNGTGKTTCRECHGNGMIRCDKCGGTGTCRRCGGSGEIRCPECNGKGKIIRGDSVEKCWKCRGTGYVDCPEYNCDHGKCSSCSGRGENKCSECWGKGEVTCPDCYGDKNCWKCHGTGKVTCSRCGGTSVYTTFSYCQAGRATAKTTLNSSDQFAEYLEKAEQELIYDDVVVKYKNVSETEFGREHELGIQLDEALQHTPNAFDKYTEKYMTYLKEVIDVAHLYKMHPKISRIPAVKVSFRVNDTDYYVQIFGKNGVVVYDALPTKIADFKDNIFQRLRKFLTKKQRMVAYTKLAAYIFQCDGADVKESRMIESFVNQMHLKDKDVFLDKLSQYQEKYMPFSVLRKEIKCLFVSKKVLSFAWQCMTLDKVVSEQEGELFDTLCKEVGVTDEIEKNKYKGYANRFAKMNESNIVEEYLR